MNTSHLCFKRPSDLNDIYRDPIDMYKSCRYILLLDPTNLKHGQKTILTFRGVYDLNKGGLTFTNTSSLTLDKIESNNTIY